MSIFNFHKNKHNRKQETTKEDIFKFILEQQRLKSPSEIFASGAIFDFSKTSRVSFVSAIQSENPTQLLYLFIQAYHLFLENPECAGLSASMINVNNNDTNVNSWCADTFSLASKDKAALLFMPITINNNNLLARVVGIIFSDRGDGYYYCMLNKDHAMPSSVFCNKGIHGIEQIGEVNGLGFELMHSFFDCISKDFYNKVYPEYRWYFYLEKRGLSSYASKIYTIQIYVDRIGVVPVNLLGRQNCNDVLRYLREAGLISYNTTYRITNWPNVEPVWGLDYHYVGAFACEININCIYYVQECTGPIPNL